MKRIKTLSPLLILTVLLLASIFPTVYAESSTIKVPVTWLPDWMEHGPFRYNEELGWMASLVNGNWQQVTDVATGKKIDAYQDIANDFFDGLAWVASWQLKGGYINTQGEVVIPPQYDYVSDFSEGVAVVGRRTDDDRLKYGIIDTSGTVVVPFEYDKIYPFSNGMARVEKNGSTGFVDKTGSQMYSDIYECISDFSEGLAVVKGYGTEGKYGFIDKTGVIVIPMEYDTAQKFSNGLAPVKKGGKYGFLDKTGAMVTPEKYDFAGLFSDGLALVCVGEKYGFIDATGAEIVPLKYDRAENFSNGFALVREEKAFYGFINTAGEEVISVEGMSAHNFSNGFAKVEAKVGYKLCYGLIDTSGDVVLPVEYDWIDCESLGGVISIEKDSHYGIVKSSKNLFLNPQELESNMIKPSGKDDNSATTNPAQRGFLIPIATIILVVGLAGLGLTIKKKWPFPVLAICILFAICAIGLLAPAIVSPSSLVQTPPITAPTSTVPSSQLPSQSEPVSTSPSLAQEPDSLSVDMTFGYWESNSFRWSDQLIYQFKTDGSYDYWYASGGLGSSGYYTYEDWILVLQDSTGQEMDRLYYAIETSQFISIMTQHIVDQERIDSNGVFIPARFEATTLTCHETPTAPNPYGEVVPSTVSVDISNPAMYRKLNIFLSNFSECRFPSFSAEAPDYGAIADFAFMHAWINSPSVIEDYSKFFPVYDDYDAIATCVSVSYIEKVALRFFVGEANVSEIESAWKNGHGQGVITNGMYGLGFTLVDSVTDLGEDQFKVQFHIYTGPQSDGPTYDSDSTSSIYSAHPDNLPRPLYVPQNQDCQYVGTPGSAIIKAVQQEDGSLSFFLCAYSV